jgi:hypothetical protein
MRRTEDIGALELRGLAGLGDEAAMMQALAALERPEAKKVRLSPEDLVLSKVQMTRSRYADSARPN